MTTPDDPEIWFAARRFGIGAGIPVRWQGWLLILSFLVVAYGSARLPPPQNGLVLGVDLVVLVFLSRRHTAGGWRWRWGGKD